MARFAGDSDFVNALAVEIFSFSQSACPSDDLVARLLPLVADAAVSQFELQKYSSTSKKSSSQDDYPYSSWPDCCDDCERGRRDAGILTSLYQHILKFNVMKASELLDQIQAQTECLDCDELDRLILPFLEQMMYTMDLRSDEARRFYQRVMTTYMTQLVQKEPVKPSDWARPDEQEECHRKCPDCRWLHEFLMDSREESCSFVLPKDYSHLISSIPRQCKTSIDKSQRPSVLLVTKTLQAWKENHSQWQQRLSKVQATFRRFPQEALRLLLAEKYEAITGLRMAKEDSTTQTSDTLRRSNENCAEERSRSKRLRE